MRSAVANVVYGLIWLTLFFELLFDSSIRQAMLSFCEQHIVLAPLVLMLAQVLLASFALPCSPLTVFAGVLWGFEIGILYSTTATILSSLCTFFFSRYVLKKRFSGKFKFKWWPKISGVIEHYKWKASMVAHANPLFPGSSLGYVFGASEISPLSFLFGAFMGTLPLQLMTVGLGFLIAQGFDGYNFTLSLLILVLVASILFYRVFAPTVFEFFERKKE